MSIKIVGCIILSRLHTSIATLLCDESAQSNQSLSFPPVERLHRAPINDSDQAAQMHRLI